MGLLSARRGGLALLLALVSSGCNLVLPFDLAALPHREADGDVDSDADGDADDDAVSDGDTESDGDVDDSGPQGPGPMTFVATTIRIRTDRLFDLDGDGSLDNTIADLGPGGDGMSRLLEAMLRAGSEDSSRLLVHLPWVEDRVALNGASVVPIFVDGVDTDDERFFASARSLDACGEPLDFFAEASLGDGTLAAMGGTFPLSLGSETSLRRCHLSGSIWPGGAEMTLVVGGALPVREAGAVAATEIDPSLSLLEVLLAGGEALGLPGVPGLSPDLDLDGDGLESFETDEDGAIRRCIDGDRAVIEGRDCWQDARMQDAFSLTLGMSLVSALFAGREPGWQDLVEGECPDPPEQSLFDPP